jgi:uncharacterized short protein YbdD (DUF466 family)
MMTPLQAVRMRMRAAMRAAWGWLREVSGDNAYDLYLLRHQAKGARDGLLSASEFYCWRVEGKYNNKDSPARCC